MTQAMLINKYFTSLSEKTIKYRIYIILPFNSHQYQNSPDFGSGDFQYTSPLAVCEHSACAYLLVSVLVSKLNVLFRN